MHKEIRKQMTLRRKNFLPSLIITFLLFLSLVSTVYFIEPRSSMFIFLFFVNFFSFVFFIFSLIFASSRRGLIVSTCLTIFVILRFFGVGNILNLILIVGLGIIIETYGKIAS